MTASLTATEKAVNTPTLTSSINWESYFQHCPRLLMKVCTVYRGCGNNFVVGEVKAPVTAPNGSSFRLHKNSVMYTVKRARGRSRNILGFLMGF